jgi:hypothetical protein
MPTIETVIAERAQTHGDYKEQARLSQSLKRMLRSSRNWEFLDFYQAQSLEACCDKISRVMCGNLNEIDHWRDISGYASLVVRELEAANGGALDPEVPNAKMPKGKNVTIKSQPGDEPLKVPDFVLLNMERDMNDFNKPKNDS